MAVMIQHRHIIRWGITILIVISLILGWNLLDPQHPIRANTNHQIKEGYQAIKDQLTSDPTSPNTALGDIKSLERAATDLTTESKQYTRADDFLQHIRSVVRLPAVTVRDAASTCTWDSAQPVNFQYSPETAWNANPLSNGVISSHRKEWQNFLLRDTVPWGKVERQFQGRGIVVLAGNQRTFLRSMVFFRALSATKTKLPVELHYFGNELSAQNRTDIKALYPNLFFNDLNDTSQIVKGTGDNWVNYNLKTAAVLNSKFAEIILLDSDNIPLEDPATMFESNVYRRLGTIFWPDIARTRPLNPAWALTNTPCRMQEYEQESGQMVVDKTRFWYHLQLANFWTNDKFVETFLLGDKDTFRFAWHALKTEYGRPARWLTSIGTVHRPRNEVSFPRPVGPREDGVTTSDSKMSSEEERKSDRKNGGGYYCGHTFAQHHPDATTSSHIVFLHGGLLKSQDKPILRHEIEYGAGVFSAYKDSSGAADASHIEPVGIKWDGGEYLEKAEKDLMKYPAFCVDFWDVIPGPVGDEHTKELKDVENRVRKFDVYWTLNHTGSEPLKDG
ncbi:glycosyltransferase family 71 protein [Myriangium duriaei CBS 260.36]|uniref:Glycosyltransferase family 71 protein n=1 Tax=Myriangium duriaei CBS 260.36 TaxID=1168546 RepID=A0A9P4IVD6_9PEZI|nr:glycosyltransferase family 71 protein [Myriangium duriaei CBS 260.36]